MSANERALKAKIDEIKASGMAEARWAKMLAKKEDPAADLGSDPGDGLF